MLKSSQSRLSCLAPAILSMLALILNRLPHGYKMVATAPHRISTPSGLNHFGSSSGICMKILLWQD